jgi:DNA-directed RNA polymerase specialized sigma24 family protein
VRLVIDGVLADMNDPRRSMTLPAPYAEADDAALVEGCVSGDEDAWRVLSERHGRLVDVVVVRVLDARVQGIVHGDEEVARRVFAELAREQAAPLRLWSGESRLRTYVAVVARHVATTFSQETTPTANLVASLPTPQSITLDEVAAVEPARAVTQALTRLSPNVIALVHLRLRGLDAESIAATLGVSRPGVEQSLERIAARLGEASGETVAGSADAWRLLLDVAPIAERVALAVRTEDDEAFRGVRSRAEATWRAVRQNSVFHVPVPRGPLCLDDRTVAGFVDGTLRGSARARIEGHVTTCERCIDEVALLAADLRALEPLRDAEKTPRDIALAAACLATTRFRAAEQLAERAAESAPLVARDLGRLAQLGRALEGGRAERASPSVSQLIATGLPSDEEAPLVALEALVAGEPETAARAIDDHTARTVLGARLRLLALAAATDPAAARSCAESAHGRPHADPGLAEDAAYVLALPEARLLPRELVVARLRDLLPEAVRFVLAQTRS